MSANQSPTAGTGASLTSAPDAAHHSESTPMNNTPLTWEGERAPFAKAFIAAQKATEAVKKASTNPAFKSRYADLAVVVEAVIPALNESGIAVIQRTRESDYANFHLFSLAPPRPKQRLRLPR